MKKPIPFGKYLLLERVNVGGMAEVFKAKAFGVEGFERLVAVKRILPSIAEDTEFITMFIDEAKIAVQLTHANIAQIFDLGKVGDSYFIALEYVQGKDLRAIFDRARKRGEPLPIPMACYVIMKLCEGLDYAHNKRDAAGRDLHLVHRDVSPQNILISYDGEAKIIDFGIAKAAGKAGKTQAGILKGKFGYMSPEQVRGLPLDRRSDVFAVGIVLYELLTGERLFAGESDFSTLERVRNVEIMPPSTYNRKVPEELEQIVLKALSRDVDERYQTAMDLHDDLQSFMYTSGNFFARKDLSAYMRKSFADEISRETTRDEEYQRVTMESAMASGVASLADLEEPERPAESTDADALLAANVSATDGPVPPKKPTSQMPAVPPPPPARTTVPPVAPAPRSAPPVPAGRASVPPALPAAASPAPAAATPALAAAPMTADGPRAQTSLDMDWDDDEMSTQLYDKPEEKEAILGALEAEAAGRPVDGKATLLDLNPPGAQAGAPAPVAAPAAAPPSGAPRAPTGSDKPPAAGAPSPPAQVAPAMRTGSGSMPPVRVPSGSMPAVRASAPPPGSPSVRPGVAASPPAAVSPRSGSASVPPIATSPIGSNPPSRPSTNPQMLAAPPPSAPPPSSLAHQPASQSAPPGLAPATARSGAPSPFGPPSTRPADPLAPPRARKQSSLLPFIAIGAVIVLAALVGVAFLIIGGKQNGTIQVTTVPTDAIVLFDDHPLSGAQSPFYIYNVEPAPRNHVLVVRKDGYQPYRTQVQVGSGALLPVGPVTLAADGPSAGIAARGTGFVLDTEPTGATVYVDDRIVPGHTPVTVSDLAPGSHRIRVDHGTPYAPWETTVQLVLGQMLTFPKQPLSVRILRVSFRSDPVGAAVTLVRGEERRPVGPTPIDADIDTTGNAWTVEVRKDGFDPWMQALAPAPGQTTVMLSATLARSGAPVAVAPPTAVPLPPTTVAVAPPQPGGLHAPLPVTPTQTSPTQPPVAAAPTHTTPHVAHITTAHVRPPHDVPPEAPTASGGGATGTLQVNTRPWSQVYVDGALVGNTPQMNIQLRAGSHRVMFVNTDFNIRETVSVSIQAGSTQRLVRALVPGG